MTSLIVDRGRVVGSLPEVPGRDPNPLTRFLRVFYTDESRPPYSATLRDASAARARPYRRKLIDSCPTTVGRGLAGAKGGTFVDQSGRAVSVGNGDISADGWADFGPRLTRGWRTKGLQLQRGNGRSRGATDESVRRVSEMESANSATPNGTRTQRLDIDGDSTISDVTDHVRSVVFIRVKPSRAYLGLRISKDLG